MRRSSFAERLDRLEDRLWSRFPELAPLSDPRRWKHAEDRLCETLPRHVLGKLIEGHDLSSAAGRGGVDVARSGPANLFRAYQWVLWRGVRFGAPLDLSGRLTEIYLEDPGARAADVCRECRYGAPVSSRRRYFERCPLCGGELCLDPSFTASEQPSQP